ncbi:hypothetical protein MOX01_15050 [Microbacterium oxydans]|nr:hypothetical protein MOX01_15050 [Microbacterium oxydans]
MRSPGRKRPIPHSLDTEVAPSVLEKWADFAQYVGSPEHKSYPSFAGPPRLRSDATQCPKQLNDANQVTEWLRRGILDGNVSAYRDGGNYPRYVWGWHLDRWFEARLVNSEQGTYKGYPVRDDEVPPTLRNRA